MIFAEINRRLDELAKSGHKIQEILSHDTMVFPGWVFLVKQWDKYFLIFNTSDLIASWDLIGAKTIIEAAELEPKIFDVRLYANNKERIGNVMKGIFEWSCKFNPKNGQRTQATLPFLDTQEPGKAPNLQNPTPDTPSPKTPPFLGENEMED